jgi:ribonuclease HI
MEMVAAIRALAALEEPITQNIILYTDSTYLIKGITQWIWGWRSKGWKNAEGKDVANRELWEELLRQVTRLKPSTIDWKYVRGHAGFPGNERCDQIAVSFAKSNPEQLYSGDREGYFVDLENLPAEEFIPEKKFSNKSSSSGATRSGDTSKGSYGNSSGGAHKSSGSSSGPATYLSYYGGVVKRHTTWVDCEKHVKGRNAKFKKAKSRDDEKEILRSWGLDPQTSIQ